MPQLSITGDQVDPLTLLCLFFLKCKNMHSLWKERKTYAVFSVYSFICDTLINEVAFQYLFAALGESDGHVLAREEPPDRGGLAGPQSRLVG